MTLNIEPQKTPIARQWRRYDRMLGPAGHKLLDMARLMPGERVLDVACGAGGTTLEAAHRVGKLGAAAGVDVDGGAIRVAQTRAREQLLGWTTFAAFDVERGELPKRSFHAIVSRFGISSFADPCAALERLGAALVPGGRVVFVCFKSPRENAWFSLPRAAVLESLGPELGAVVSASALGARPFALAEREVLERAVERAGLRATTIEAFTTSVWVGDDVDDALEFFFETDGRPLDAWLDQKSFERLATALRRALAPHARTDGVWLPAATWIVAAGAPAG